MTRAEFAVKHGFGKNLFGRIVQGRLPSVTPRIADALWGEWRERGLSLDDFEAEYHTTDLDLAYQNWVSSRRLANRGLLPSVVDNDPAITPFARVVKKIGSVSKTAQTLAVSDVVVQRYADGRQKVMPVSVRKALQEMKYPNLEALDAAQKRWHMNREER